MLTALIPAYNPIETLPQYIRDLVAEKLFTKIIVVNDGSKATFDAMFAELAHFPDVVVLKHAVNQGKGAAIKTGLNYIACEFEQSIGIVTIDADGQHTTLDACRVAKTLLENPNNLIVGVRNFKGEVPFRSLLGNIFTRYTLRIVGGIKLSDTQSGLRGIPIAMIPLLLAVEANAYEFELDMLIAANLQGFKIKEIAIETVYLDGNARSSFRPLWDSLRIYFVLLRFSIIAGLSAMLDYAVFMLVYFLITPNVMAALVCSRIVSVTFNYLNVRRYAFRSHEKHIHTLPKYLALALISGLMAYALITGLMSLLDWNVVWAKVVAEFIMFIINFLIQRDFIFRRQKE